MAGKSTATGAAGVGGGLSAQLMAELENLIAAATQRLVAGLGARIGDATHRLTEYAAKGGGPGLAGAATGVQQLAAGSSPLKAMVSAGVAGGKEKLRQMAGGKGGRGGRGGRGKLKVTNMVEAIDVGAPPRVVYNQWTQFEDFPSFMKKVESVEQTADERLDWKAQIFWSHRTWESTIIEQVPDKRIVWRSTGEKGSVDGAVTFHELAPELTRIVLVLEYNPQGLFERTGNIWRAQGRRVRLELKHFVRHVMTQTVLHPDEVEGWRGEIRDGQVVKDHESALAEEKRRAQPPRQRPEPGEEEAEEPVPDAQRRAAGAPRRPRGAPAERPRRPVRRREEPAAGGAVRRTRTREE